MSQGSGSAGTVMWMPLAGRMDGGPGALVEGADPVGPDPGGVDHDRGPDVESLAAGRIDPDAGDPAARPGRKAVTGEWLAATAPWSSTAVRRTSRVSRASSVRASQ